ncbi:carbohydrate ABC transporter permease [Geminicoccus harenae]|uniref:carbohydrate ABC transporter permease n=1 Tax=Geminicoccus harenae TaxID=2498453 RepID=UPI00168B0235|nr:sugar ABC transporter permease [Geminicoccus harenae]
MASAVAISAPRPTSRRQVLIEKLIGCGFVFPVCVLLLLLNIVPLGVLALLSFTDYQMGAVDFGFVGLDNFAKALGDPVFRRAVTNTLIYVAIVLPGSVVLGLFAAVLIHGRLGSRPFYEIVYFLPITTTIVAMAAVWQIVLHPGLGPVNAVLQRLGFEPVMFLSDPAFALPTLAVIGIWQLVGFNMILFLAGLSAIPRDLYEAAEIDGCGSPVDRFLTVTWPLLGPTTMFVIVTSSITSFKVFDTVVAMTKGGPMGSTEVLLYAIYLEGFQYFNSSYASVLTLIFLVFILIFAVIQTFVLDKRVHY